MDLTSKQSQVANQTVGTEAIVDEIQIIDNVVHVGNVWNGEPVTEADDNPCECHI